MPPVCCCSSHSRTSWGQGNVTIRVGRTVFEDYEDNEDDEENEEGEVDQEEGEEGEGGDEDVG